MTDPQQIRRALTDIRRALDTHSRESMAEILALVFKEYVVEGQQPMTSGGNIIDARSDLEGMTFPELIVWLQTHLDLPELALFEVSGADVTVKSENGTALRVRPRANASARPPAPTPVAAAPVLRSAPIASAPPTPTAPVPAAPAPVAAAPTSTGAVAPTPAPKEESTAESGTRFSLLEVD